MSSPCNSTFSKIIVKDGSDALGVSNSPCLPDVIVTLQFQLQQNRCYGIILCCRRGVGVSRSRVQLNKVYKKSSLRFSSNYSKLVVRDESYTELGLGLVYSGNQQSTNASAVSQLINTNVTQGLSRVSLFPDTTWREGGRSEV